MSSTMVRGNGRDTPPYDSISTYLSVGYYSVAYPHHISLIRSNRGSHMNYLSKLRNRTIEIYMSCKLLGRTSLLNPPLRGEIIF